MDYQGRRNRRGRDRRCRQYIPPQSFVIPSSQKNWSLLDGISSFFILTSLIAIVYLMLDYHCNSCNPKCDLTNITKNIDDLAINISFMKDSYTDLESKVLKFSHELPKIEGQIELLESLANTMGSGDFNSPAEHKTENDIINTSHKHTFEANSRNVTRKNKVPNKSYKSEEN